MFQNDKIFFCFAVTIEDDKVCSPITKRKIELKANDYQSLFLTQSTTKYHNARWPIHWDCKFQVDASSYGGIFIYLLNTYK